VRNNYQENDMKTNSVSPSFADLGIVILTLATALIHLSLNLTMGQFDLMFTLNGIGYLALLAALFLDLPIARDYRKVVRFGFIAFTGVTIVAWIFLGDMSWWLGWVTKVIELILIGMLIVKRP
jgi:hypothetical protein